MNKGTWIAVTFGLWAPLSGCSTIDPYERPYVWRPTGVNEANLAAMLANPADLARGRGLAPSDGIAAAAAVDRLHHDRVKPLAGSNSTAAAGAAATLAPN